MGYYDFFFFIRYLDVLYPLWVKSDCVSTLIILMSPFTHTEAALIPPTIYHATTT